MYSYPDELEENDKVKKDNNVTEEISFEDLETLLDEDIDEEYD